MVGKKTGDMWTMKFLTSRFTGSWPVTSLNLRLGDSCKAFTGMQCVEYFPTALQSSFLKKTIDLMLWAYNNSFVIRIYGVVAQLVMRVF